MPEPPWYAAAARDLRALSDLTPNWDSYGARPITPAAIAAALAFCRTLTSDVPRPRVVPTVTGRAGLVWGFGTRARSGDLELAFAPDGHLADLAWTWDSPDPAPEWARGVLARALHAVR